MVGSSMPQNALFGLVSMISWYLMTEFDQTFTTNGLWGKDQSIKFWSQKVIGQGHSGVKNVGRGIIVIGVV